MISAQIGAQSLVKIMISVFIWLKVSIWYNRSAEVRVKSVPFSPSNRRGVETQMSVWMYDYKLTSLSKCLPVAGRAYMCQHSIVAELDRNYIWLPIINHTTPYYTSLFGLAFRTRLLNSHYNFRARCLSRWTLKAFLHSWLGLRCKWHRHMFTTDIVSILLGMKFTDDKTVFRLVKV